ncbi:DUF167 family protein [Hyphomicrobium sp.]|uniref:DUF167 family protein n=1 Tax=Hyphomicrobium sp. TaxID=82 RepID=UPI001DCDE6F6|nr:DUF167 family protein [Hyphomicrobium sp.]MBY0560604.1 DUF167 family protein [Hyphomicrobium sp.]
MISRPASQPPARKAWRHGSACVIAHFRLTPKSSKEAIDGIVETPDGPAFQARVRALPEDGAANRALEELAARWLGVTKSSVSLARGGKSRLKSLKISGDPETLERLLQERTNELRK